MGKNKKGLLQRAINQETTKIDIESQRKTGEIKSECNFGGGSFNPARYVKLIRREHESYYERRIGIMTENYVDIIFDGRLKKPENITEILDYIEPNTRHWIEAISRDFQGIPNIGNVITKIQTNVEQIIKSTLSNTKTKLDLQHSMYIQKRKNNFLKLVRNNLLAVLTLIFAVLTYQAVMRQAARDKGKLKIEYVDFIETKNGDRLSKETGFELEITNIGNRRVVTNFLIASNKPGELKKWQRDFSLNEGESRSIRVTLAHPNFWVLKEVEKLVIIDTKGGTWSLTKKDIDKIKNIVINLYEKWILPEDHNVDESQFFILRKKVKTTTPEVAKPPKKIPQTMGLIFPLMGLRKHSCDIVQ